MTSSVDMGGFASGGGVVRASGSEPKGREATVLAGKPGLYKVPAMRKLVEPVVEASRSFPGVFKPDLLKREWLPVFKAWFPESISFGELAALPAEMFVSGWVDVSLMKQSGSFVLGMYGPPLADALAVVARSIRLKDASTLGGSVVDRHVDLVVEAKTPAASVSLQLAALYHSVGPIDDGLCYLPLIQPVYAARVRQQIGSWPPWKVLADLVSLRDDEHLAGYSLVDVAPGRYHVKYVGSGGTLLHKLQQHRSQVFDGAASLNQVAQVVPIVCIDCGEATSDVGSSLEQSEVARDVDSVVTLTMLPVSDKVAHYRLRPFQRFEVPMLMVPKGRAFVVGKYSYEGPAALVLLGDAAFTTPVLDEPTVVNVVYFSKYAWNDILRGSECEVQNPSLVVGGRARAVDYAAELPGVVSTERSEWGARIQAVIDYFVSVPDAPDIQRGATVGDGYVNSGAAGWQLLDAHYTASGIVVETLSEVVASTASSSVGSFFAVAPGLPGGVVLAYLPGVDDTSATSVKGIGTDVLTIGKAGVRLRSGQTYEFFPAANLYCVACYFYLDVENT